LELGYLLDPSFVLLLELFSERDVPELHACEHPSSECGDTYDHRQNFAGRIGEA
jgi:hypothetical protein